MRASQLTDDVAGADVSATPVEAGTDSATLAGPVASETPMIVEGPLAVHADAALTVAGDELR